MGKCKVDRCRIYRDGRCCYECEVKEKCSKVCVTTQKEEICEFYTMNKKEKKLKMKKVKVKRDDFIRDVVAVAIGILTAIGAIELFGELSGSVVLVLLIIIVWILPDRKKGEEKHEDNFR